MTYEYEQFLAHYGIKGQKWGVRNWQNEDGTYNDAGRERYWGGNHRQRGGTSTPQAAAVNSRRQADYRSLRTRLGKRESARGVKDNSPEAVAARKRKRNLIIAGAAALAIGALAYHGYRQTGKLRDQMRKDMIKGAKDNLKYGNKNFQEYWDAKDKRQYKKRYMQMMREQANRIDRKDALGKKLGLDLQSRQRKVADLRSSSKFGNWLGDSNRRGDLNKQISDARKELAYARGEGKRRFVEKMTTAKDRAYNKAAGVQSQFDRMISNYDKNVIDARKQQLDDLLKRKASGKLYGW